MIFFPLMLTKRIKDYTVFFNILNLKQTCRLQESTLKRVILNKCCSRIKSFSQKKSKTKLKKKKDSSNNHRVSPCGDKTLPVLSKAICITPCVDP